MPSTPIDEATALAALFDTFVTPPPESRPMMRWWWFGPDVERDELVRELTAMRDAGIGGVEVAFTYPLSKVEDPFLSPAFLDDLRFAAETAGDLGLRFDLTLGSGWSYGGPHITDATAARALRWDVRDIGPLSAAVRLAPTHPGDEFVAAYLGDGSLQEPPLDFEPLARTNGVNGEPLLEIAPATGPRVLVVVWSSVTGQQVKRAASGAEGPVLDHYSASATRDHLRAVADPLLRAVPAELLGSVFCDSLEAYGANWTTDLPAEFERRHGHPLLRDLWRLRFDSDASNAFRAEYYETLGELYEENFLDVVRAWSADHGVPFRVQSYGAPPARLRSYRHADLTEGEGWGWRGIPQTKWASSAAHHGGRAVVSSETWTWVHSPSFRATPLDLKGEAHEHFLLGINKLIGHGWPYTPPDAAELGWFFYASGALDDRNSWWAAMPSLTRYLARLSHLLQQGEPVREVLLYLPAQDVYAKLGPEQGGTLDLWRQLRDRIGPDIPAAIRDAGFDFDLVDDDTLDELVVGESTIVVLPFVSSLPERMARVLRAVHDAGGTVLSVVDNTAQHSTRIPGDRVTAPRLRDELLTRRDADLTLEPDAPAIGFVHRALTGGDVYVVVNTGSATESFVAHPRSLRRVPTDRWQLWSPDYATVIAEGDSESLIEIRLAPYQAVVLVTGNSLSPASVTSAASEPTRERALETGWTARFLDAGESGEASVELPHVWEPERAGYAGRVEYLLTLDSNDVWPQGLPERVVLDFGRGEPERQGEDGEAGIRGSSYRALLRPPVGEIVGVEVNGAEFGVLYAPPYEVDIASALVVGANTLRLVVANVTASAFTDDGVRRAVDEMVALSRELYGQRFRMQDLDAATDGLRSGLLEVPRLRWV
ncbi:glycosyl hydrolase [Humibacter sp. RRB41]|uniref:glycosyl hydrolase n=1 Tax=Humibacter sp. RRB41 TaxID=2919946 RepID=UPI001FAA0C22|nr:glycosyl hydrolase [Humibacter sp. RRB41]